MSILLNNTRIWLIKSESEPKTTVQAKEHLKIHRHIYNSAKHLKCPKKERPAKLILAWNYFQRVYNMSDRNLNTVELLNIPGF